MLKLGSHVGMSGKKMMLGSVEEALSYGANTFMLYTGAPQNTKRKDLSELNTLLQKVTVEQLCLNIVDALQNFPNFKDERMYKGKTVYLYKLAQLLTSDILHIIEMKEILLKQ